MIIKEGFLLIVDGPVDIDLCCCNMLDLFVDCPFDN